MKISDLVKPGLEQLNPEGSVIVDPAKAAPFPPLELIGEKITSPIRPGVPDLIEGLMPKRGQLVIAGETNVGKTTIALEIVSSLTTGVPLWKEKKPTEVIGRVLYVLGEHYNDVVKGLWNRMGIPMGDDVWILGPEQLTVDKWLVQSGKQNPVAISKLISWAKGADLIVFDPLSAFLTGSDAENDNIQMRLVLDSMSLIAQSVDASCLVLAHQGKPAVGKDGQEFARTKYAIRGASAIEDAATNIFYMSRVQGASSVAETRDSKVFEMRNRKYKGDAPDKYELVKDPHNLTHTLLGNRPYIQVRQMETMSTYGRFQLNFPEASKSDLLKMVECATGLSEASIRRALETKDERGK